MRRDKSLARTPAAASPGARRAGLPRRGFWLGLSALAGAMATGSARAGATDIALGVLPNVSAAQLAAQYEPLRRHLERGDAERGALAVRLVPLAGFRAFARGLLAGDFDLAVAAPHFARVAQLDAALVPLVMFEPRIEAQLVAPAAGRLSSAAQLRGRTIALANPGSLVAMCGLRWLSAKGLEAGRDYKLVSARTDFGVGRLLLTGGADAAILSGGELRVLPAEEQARVRVVETFDRLPNFIVMAHPRLGAPALARLKSRLLALPGDADHGQAFLRATGVTAIVEADESTLRELDKFSEATRRLMSGAG